jgi:hypothetical protein
VHDTSLTHRADSHRPPCRVANAATNIAHAPHPPRCQIETVHLHLGDVLLPWWRQEVLGGCANSPPCNLLRVDKITFGHGAMSSGHSTISLPRPALKRYEQRVHTMDQLMVSFQHWAGSADEDINLFLVGGKNYSWQLHEGHDGEIDGLGSKIGPKPPPGYQMKAHIKGFRLV